MLYPLLNDNRSPECLVTSLLYREGGYHPKPGFMGPRDYHLRCDLDWALFESLRRRNQSGNLPGQVYWTLSPEEP